MKIDLTKEQVDFIIQICDYEIKENEDLINNLYDEREIKVWKEENKFIKGIMETLKIEKQFIIQGLTPKQEDYIIESQLERIREERQNE